MLNRIVKKENSERMGEELLNISEGFSAETVGTHRKIVVKMVVGLACKVQLNFTPSKVDLKIFEQSDKKL